MTDFFVNITPFEAMQVINNHIVGGSITGEKIDEYVVNNVNDGTVVAVMVFEKHFYRAGNRLTLTVVIDNLGGRTRVHSVGGGGGEGFFRFDWGASESFENSARNALRNYII